MRGFTCLLATALVMTITLTAFAGSDIPNLKGTWVVKVQGVLHDKLDEMQPKRHIDARKGNFAIDFTLTIDKQEGFRFSGVKSSAKRKETMSGVIGFDNKSVYIVDDDTMMFGQMVAPDKMEQVWIHITKHRSSASRGLATRKR